MKAIWKWELRVGNDLTLTMPVGAGIMALQTQRGVPCLWAEVDESAETETRTFAVRGTGQSFLKAKSDRYIGTWQDGGFVWHLYECKRSAMPANDIQARTTVGSSFIAPEPNDEALVAKLASFLYGKVAMREDHATQSAAAEDYARNLVQFLILDYDIKPKDRK